MIMYTLYKTTFTYISIYQKEIDIQETYIDIENTQQRKQRKNNNNNEII